MLEEGGADHGQQRVVMEPAPRAPVEVIEDQLLELLARLLALQLRPRLGVGTSALRPVERIGALRVPVLVIAGEMDRHTTLAESRRRFSAAPDPKGMSVVPGAAHGELQRVGGAE